MNKDFKNPLIVALDVDSLDKALALADELKDSVAMFKIGYQLFSAYGPQAVREILARGKDVFLDLKFHDIPNTVARGIESVLTINQSQAGKPSANVRMLTVHTIGGKDMLIAAMSAVKAKASALKVPRPWIVGVTVLTSTSTKSFLSKKTSLKEKNDREIGDAGIDNIQRVVLERSRLAFDCGLDGVVASPQEAQAIRNALGKDFIIVTPGIRPMDQSNNDQKRVATPREAIDCGSHFLVVGRPIVEAKSPYQAAQDILKEIHKTNS